jgi:hypothetical protein
MLIKRIFSIDDLILTSNVTLIKVADAEGLDMNYKNPEVVRWIKEEFHAKEGHCYPLISALGASEFWGPNNRGDIWPEQSLNPSEKEAWWGYKSFEKFGNVYRHHFNFDPKFAIGTILKAFYAPEMRRVELIAEIPNNNASDIIEAAEKGLPVEVSMGAKIPEGDYCSKCGWNAHSASLYCNHLKEKMASIDETTGEYIGAINKKPVFHDLSIVREPAAFESGVLDMIKIASAAPSSAELANLLKYDPDINAFNFLAYKHTPAIENVIYREKQIPIEPLCKIASSVHPAKLLSSLALLGVVLNPREFQAVVLSHRVGKQASKWIQPNSKVFTPTDNKTSFSLSLADVDQDIAKHLAGLARQRSGFEPFVLHRFNTTNIDNSTWQFTKSAELPKELGALYNS